MKKRVDIKKPFREQNHKLKDSQDIYIEPSFGAFNLKQQ